MDTIIEAYSPERVIIRGAGDMHNITKKEDLINLFTRFAEQHSAEDLKKAFGAIALSLGITHLDCLYLPYKEITIKEAEHD